AIEHWKGNHLRVGSERPRLTDASNRHPPAHRVRDQNLDPAELSGHALDALPCGRSSRRQRSERVGGLDAEVRERLIEEVRAHQGLPRSHDEPQLTRETWVEIEIDRLPGGEIERVRRTHALSSVERHHFVETVTAGVHTACRGP